LQAEPLSAADGRARAWMGQGGEAGAEAPHASSRARRVERRLVGASVGAFGRRNASTACQRDGLVPRNCNALGSRTSPGGPPGQIWARPSPRAVAASNRGLERGWSAGWGRRLQRRRGRARGCKCAPRARRPGRRSNMLAAHPPTHNPRPTAHMQHNPQYRPPSGPRARPGYAAVARV
jgi:hypothetical protein